MCGGSTGRGGRCRQAQEDRGAASRLLGGRDHGPRHRDVSVGADTLEPQGPEAVAAGFERDDRRAEWDPVGCQQKRDGRRIHRTSTIGSGKLNGEILIFALFCRFDRFLTLILRSPTPPKVYPGDVGGLRGVGGGRESRMTG